MWTATPEHTPSGIAERYRGPFVSLSHETENAPRAAAAPSAAESLPNT